MHLLPLGDSAVLVRFGDRPDTATFARVRAALRELQRNPLVGQQELVPSYTDIAVVYDAEFHSRESFLELIRDRLADLPTAAPAAGRLIEIPVRYGGEDGPDLADVARSAGMISADAAALHAASEYEVRMIGFAPGFGYLAGLPERLATPRLETPRLHVPAGSVGIAGGQTGVYPFDSPGGWRIIGRTSLRMFDPSREPAALLSVGDRVRFVPVELASAAGAAGVPE